MLIQINTDHNIEGGEEQVQWVSALEEAVSGAAEKMKHAVESLLGRLARH